MALARVAPPSTLEELSLRVRCIEGRTLGELAEVLSFDLSGGPVHTKGKIGELVERVLGACGVAGAVHDFPELGVELKTIPIDSRGVPHESTFVCAISLTDAEYATWSNSWARKKLQRVLWVPVHDPPDGGSMLDRVLGSAVFWSPNTEQDAILGADFDELMGKIGAGGIESVSGRVGRWMQIRPKAATGRVRTVAYGPNGERIETVPRGFYLRARFTGALLADVNAVPE